MKDRNQYLGEVETRLHLLFRASKDGFKATPSERHRLEGFIQAGIYLELTTREELQELMDQVHHEVFGKSIAERQGEQSSLWTPESIDYGQFDQPTFERSSH